TGSSIKWRVTRFIIWNSSKGSRRADRIAKRLEQHLDRFAHGLERHAFGIAVHLGKDRGGNDGRKNSVALRAPPAKGVRVCSVRNEDRLHRRIRMTPPNGRFEVAIKRCL